MKTFFTCVAMGAASLFASDVLAVLTPRERAVVRRDAREVRGDVRRAGALWNPAERAVSRHDVQDLRGDVRRDVRRQEGHVN
jgi:hypothetical protein